MRKSIFFYKELTPAEVGKTGTHEVYVRLPNNFDYESFFGDSAVLNGSVMEVHFTAQDITNEGEKSTPLRFVYFKNSNQEKRIPSLGPLFKSHNVQEGDVVCLESRIDGTSYSYYLCFYKKGEIQVNPAAVYFSKIEKAPANTPHNSNIEQSLQQIFYGAPGTGKSHKIKDDADVKAADEKNLVFRTTFHPDSDYSTFVGAYKPTTTKRAVRNVAGDIVKDTNKEDVYEDCITYSFIPQAFLQAYVAAWNNPDDKVFLVIEEINRGNCAQIFGDLFQLLDRDGDGVSEYPIMADKDIAKYLNGNDEEELPVLTNKDGIKDGKLRLPKNLYIWATMNTSDQSLFPIDSAFKRRWDWQYMPIANGNKGWHISANGNEYDWWEFLEKINALIGEKTSSEDKKLGYYFCKAKDGLIDAKMFVGKVIFYLWNDVFKDYEFEGDAFNDVEGKLTFDKFYKTIDGTTSVVEEKVVLFLKNLGIVPVVESEDEDVEDVDDPDSAEGKDYTRYTINGEGDYPKRQLSTQAVRKYIELHPDLTPEQVVADWMSLGNIVSHFVETKEQFDARTDNSKRSHEVPCGDTKIYVAWNGWGLGSKMQTLITAVNSKDWGITLAIKE